MFDRRNDRGGPPAANLNKNWVPNYKDLGELSKCISTQGKIYDRKRLLSSAKQQRKLTTAIKRARFLALLKISGR